jgi:ribosomal-protein-alanine N-acetyltransferase
MTRRYLVTGDRVALRRPSARDTNEFTQRAAESRALHHPWMEPPDSPELFAAYLRRCRRRDMHGFFVHERSSGRLCGFVNISNVVGGVFQSGYLGYAAFAGAAGQGYLSEGVTLVVRYAFDSLGLHRLEANVQPTNAASLRLVERCGFRREGYSPDYLFIDGAWRDHERWAITR